MQDYPHHLYLTQILTTWNDPSLDWKEHYQVDLGLRPYMLWFLIMKPLATWFGVETAGRIVFSGSVLVTAGVVLRARRDAPEAHEPWGALLLFPLTFHQTYFMGFTNYFVSIPVLFLAMQSLERLSRGATQRAWAGHALLLIVLFLNHPYAVLVYMGLATAGAVALRKDRSAALRVLTPTIVLAVAFALWFGILHGRPRSAAAVDKWETRWWPWEGTLGYYLMMFTGMRWHGHPNLVAAALWLITFALFGRAALQRPPGARWPLHLFLASVSGVAILPFWLGYYSYFNLRLAPISYFALALVLGRLALGTGRGVAVAVLASLLLAISIRTQRGVSDETEEILPIAEKTGKNTALLNLMFDSASDFLDPKFFYEIHSHEVAYCHLRNGGGVDPDLFPSTMLPVQYREGYFLPFPEPAYRYTPAKHARYYNYFLTRGAPPAMVATLSSHADLVVQSGEWLLFHNRTPPPR